ncbi:hypothetical protein ABFT80_13455 [Mesorhizobium sp. SB112]|uniref:hypothetical protein n=1 Tax=Mesorhizobium sp. SB112 TaxID=3151853 RepID=UPI003264C5B7
MKILDHQEHAWFLLEEDGQLYLDAFCSHSFFDYTVLISLNADEAAAYRKIGRTYLDRLAHDIHYSAPAVTGSKSPYKHRNLTVPATREDNSVKEAIAEWRKTS